MKRGTNVSPATAVISGLKDMLVPKRPLGKLSAAERLDGKTCLVTGASSGLGKASAIGLARLGAKVIMACRSGHPEAGREVRKKSGSTKVSMERVDLADLGTVRKLCLRLKKKKTMLDTAVFNAGVVPAKARRTAQGFEEMFGVNYLSSFYFVKLLLKHGLFRKALGRDLPRIIFVSSEIHRSPSGIDWSGFGRFREYAMAGSMDEYGKTKLMVSTFAVELGRRLKNKIAVHHLCPGAVNTNIAREAPAWVRPLLKMLFGILFKSPARAARPVLYLCASRDITGRTGIYLHTMVKKEPAPAARDPRAGRKLWTESEKLLRKGPKN